MALNLVCQQDSTAPNFNQILGSALSIVQGDGDPFPTDDNGNLVIDVNSLQITRSVPLVSFNLSITIPTNLLSTDPQYKFTFPYKNSIFGVGKYMLQVNGTINLKQTNFINLSSYFVQFRNETQSVNIEMANIKVTDLIPIEVFNYNSGIGSGSHLRCVFTFIDYINTSFPNFGDLISIQFGGLCIGSQVLDNTSLITVNLKLVPFA